MDQMAGPSDPTPLQSSSNDLRRRMRMLYESENARAILLAVGIVAFFALASLYSENRDEHQTAVPACDSNSCSDAFANVPPATSTPEETPTVGRVHSDDPDHQPAPAAEPHRKPARIAKSNPPGIVVSRKTGARARVGIAHAARFQAYIDDLENNHGARILFMGGTRPGRCSSSGMHPCGRHWMCVRCVAASSTRVAICRLAGRWRRLPPRMACSKAGAGAIRTMVTSSSGSPREIAATGEPASCDEPWHPRPVAKPRPLRSNDRRAVRRAGRTKRREFRICSPGFRARLLRKRPGMTAYRINVHAPAAASGNILIPAQLNVLSRLRIPKMLPAKLAHEICGDVNQKD